VDPRVIERTVREFIEDARLVTPDIALQRKAIFRVYAHLAPNVPAIVKMNEWMNSTPQSSPFKRAASETVNTEVISALPQSPTTWQIDWSETTRDLNGAIKAPPVRMRALVKVYTAPASAKTTAEQLRDNPLLIYVRDFSWSKQL
jgi:type IV secretory pathway TrbF-like protein